LLNLKRKRYTGFINNSFNFTKELRQFSCICDPLFPWSYKIFYKKFRIIQIEISISNFCFIILRKKKSYFRFLFNRNRLDILLINKWNFLLTREKLYYYLQCCSRTLKWPWLMSRLKYDPIYREYCSYLCLSTCKRPNTISHFTTP
jgi:hypothetical protein